MLDKSWNTPTQFDTKIYMSDNRRAPTQFDLSNFSEVIGVGDYVRPIIELKSLWFSAMGFGCKWRLFQGRVYKGSSSTEEDVTGGTSDEEDASDLSDYESKQRKKRKVEEPVEYDVRKIDEEVV